MKISVEQGFITALKRLPPDRAKAARSGLVKFQNAPNLPHLYFPPSKAGLAFSSSTRAEGIASFCAGRPTIMMSRTMSDRTTTPIDGGTG